mmetsp:Transcript_47264/g.34556  ORF Transcript_47264/g.34556 Transcript_47264/m.34556 type:complete len:275 (-) Transcript_47264:1306-2130(-)
MLTCRVHPGESNSQFMLQGILDFLLQPNNKEAQLLRETFIFKILPILNPDGVIQGNYRCNLLGVDLNRRWINPSKLLHPTIYYGKMLAKSLQADHSVLMFLDLHGHSRKRNVFMYGCQCSQQDVNQHRSNNLIKVVPYMLGQRSKLFSFGDCKFANEKEKEATARLVMFREMQVLNSYTLEATFYAMYNQKTFKKKYNVEDELQLKAEDLMAVGADFCQTLVSIINSKILKKKFFQEAAQGGAPPNCIVIPSIHNHVLKENNLNLQSTNKLNQS